MTLGSCRTDGCPCSCSTSATNESCTFRGPLLLPEAKPSLLASQASSDKHQNDETPVKNYQCNKNEEAELNQRKSPSDPRDTSPHEKISTREEKLNSNWT